MSRRRSYSAKKAAAGADIGKPGKNFAKIEAEGNRKYGKGHGGRIAGAILNKLRKKYGHDGGPMGSFSKKY